MLLGPERARRVTILLAVTCALVHVGLLLQVRGDRLPSGEFVFGDLHLSAGKLALEGKLGSLYDPAEQARATAAILSPEAPLDLYLSPPFMALFWAPFALLPWFWAGALWNALELALAALAARLTARSLELSSSSVLLLLLASQPFWQSMANAQDAPIALALYAGALLCFHRGRDALAGALLGLGAFKPQLFWLTPIVLLASRRWRALGAQAAVASALALLSLAIVGVEGLRAYAALLRSPLYLGLVAGHLPKTAALSSFFKALALPFATPLGLACALVIAVLAARAAWRDPERALPLACAGSLLGAPHAFIYDAIVLLVPLAYLRDSRALLAVMLVSWLHPLARDAWTSPWPARALALPWITLAIAWVFARLLQPRVS